VGARVLKRAADQDNQERKGAENVARILVLEGNDDLRGWYARELEADGHDVFQAARAAEAEDELNNGALDFVVVDITQRPADKAQDLMQILIRDGSTHVVIDIGRDRKQDGVGLRAETCPDLSRLKTRIREMMAPMNPGGQET
jgi:DNA-binding response OmpR family regulator